MAETLNVTIDDLPELGTKAAAVAGIESLIHTALRAPGTLEPERLRYWLDAYYQARRAQEIEERADGRSFAAFCADLIPRVQGGPMRASAPTEERIAAAPAEPRNDRTEADGADVHPQGTQSAPPKQAAEDGGQADAAETQQKPETAAKTQRQRPVGWTDGFEPVELKKGPAAEAAKYKREQFERLQRFLREGVTMQRIVKAAEGNINEDQILGIRECKRVPVAVYRVLEAALDRIETK